MAETRDRDLEKAREDLEQIQRLLRDNGEAWRELLSTNPTLVWEVADCLSQCRQREFEMELLVHNALVRLKR